MAQERRVLTTTTYLLVFWTWDEQLEVARGQTKNHPEFDDGTPVSVYPKYWDASSRSDGMLFQDYDDKIVLALYEFRKE